MLPKVAGMFKNYEWLKVPKIHWKLSTTRVLVMDYLEGGQVNDMEYIEANKIDKFEVASKIGQLYSNMIFINGFVHSDPHPGNILVQKNSSGSVDVVLLDHGLYAVSQFHSLCVSLMINVSFICQDLTDRFRYDYSKLWLSILNVDREGMRAHSLNLGIKRSLYPLFACMLTGRPWESVMSGVNKTRHSDAEVSVAMCTEKRYKITTENFIHAERASSVNNFICFAQHIRHSGAGRSTDAVGSENKRFDSWH